MCDVTALAYSTHSLCSRRGDTTSIPALPVPADTATAVSGGKEVLQHADHVELSSHSTHSDEDEISWTASSTESVTPIETEFAAAEGGCAPEQSTDQVHPWLDPHYFTRPGEDPLSAFSYVFDASPQPTRQSTARTHRRARSSKAAPYSPRPLHGRAVASTAAPAVPLHRGLAPGLERMRRGEHGSVHLHLRSAG